MRPGKHFLLVSPCGPLDGHTSFEVQAGAFRNTSKHRTDQILLKMYPGAETCWEGSSWRGRMAIAAVCWQTRAGLGVLRLRGGEPLFAALLIPWGCESSHFGQLQAASVVPLTAELGRDVSSGASSSSQYQCPKQGCLHRLSPAWVACKLLLNPLGSQSQGLFPDLSSLPRSSLQ